MKYLKYYLQIRGKLIGHRIKYWRQDLREVEDSQYVLSRSTKNEALIIGLQPNTYYYVRVMAYNSAGRRIRAVKEPSQSFIVSRESPFKGLLLLESLLALSLLNMHAY